MKRRYLLCLLPALLLACAPAAEAPLPAPEALVQEDPFDARYKVHCETESGRTVCVMTGNALRPFNPRYPMFSLGLISDVGPDRPSRYFLRAVLVNEKRWLNIGKGATLSITIDGESVDLAGDGSRGNRFVGERDKVYEVARYETSAETIKKIANAQEVTVAVKGDFPLKKIFGKVNSLYFQQFVRHYIDKPAAPAR